MNQRVLFSALFALPLLASASAARAGIEACGDIHVEAEAECTLEVEGGCEIACTPLSVEAACAAELQVECRGECDASAEAQCRASCDVGACVARCDVDPPAFECSAECNARAEASCNAECQASADRSECEASCRATFSAECDASCQGTPGSASCQAKCEASCEADCTARANLECQVDCQSEGYVDCKARVQGGCEAACQRPEGALFCDGQYVDAGDNLQECVAAIEAYLDVQIETSGSASGQCEGNSCSASAEGSAAASCTLPTRTDAGGAASPVLALAALMGFGAIRAARRRR